MDVIHKAECSKWYQVLLNILAMQIQTQTGTATEIRLQQDLNAVLIINVHC